MSNTWIYIKPSIVTVNGDWETSYDTDYKEFNTREEAVLHGYRTVGSDDFLVGELQNGLVINLYWDTELRDDPSEVEDVNKILSLEPVEPKQEGE